MNPINIIGNIVFFSALRRTGPSLTFARLCTSRHVGDLQWIVFFVLVLSPVLLVYAHRGDTWVSLPGLVGVIGAVLNWTYQTGSRRLGAIDLFACEISAICRVCLIVDFARQTANVVRAAPAPAAVSHNSPVIAPDGSAADVGLEHVLSKFTSAEDYTPVYDRNVSDLQELDANVVTSVTEFYTYRKTMMDFLRRIAVESKATIRADMMAQMLFMQFLMYESGRIAVEALIEYEPNREESIINILCSEILAWQVLVAHYTDDYRGSRLRLRRDVYQAIVPAVFERAEKQRDLSWARARDTAAELRRRYYSVFAEHRG